MSLTLLILIISSNAATNEKEKTILYSRMVIQGLILILAILYNNLFVKCLEKGISIYGGMFNVNLFTHGFNIFITIIIAIILVLTSFYSNNVTSIALLRKGVYKNISLSNNELEDKHDTLTNAIKNTVKSVLNKNLVHFTIIEYALIIVFVLCGAIFLMSTGDLISMFLSIELQSYGLYILSTLYRDSEYATNSGLTYFLLGGMSSCFILFGSGILYVISGTTNLENIYIINSVNELVINSYTTASLVNEQYIHLSHYISVSLILLLVGFLFKISAAPFHFWSPDVYDGIPTIVTTFVATVAKVSIFVFIVQLVLNMEFINIKYDYTLLSYIKSLYTDSSYNEESKFLIDWKSVLLFSSLMSLIVGSVLGLTQHRIKKLLAYSTISHVGFILLALSVSTIESIQAYIFYILQYTITNINAFFILIIIGFTIHYYVKDDVYKNLTDRQNSPIQLISQLKGYFYINPFISLSLAITLFSFIGIPPLLGFFAKQMVLSAALEKGYIFITLVAIITSVIGAVYYLNIIKNMFFYSAENMIIDSKPNYILSLKTNKQGSTEEKPESNLETDCKVNVVISGALSVIIGILTTMILTFIYVPNEWLRVASILSFTIFKT